MDPQPPTMPTGPEPAGQTPESQPLPQGPELPPAGSAAPPPAQPAQPAVTPPLPAAPPPAPAPGAVAPAGLPTPQAAEDVDVIEKEWVDAAEGMVKATSEDPHQEEEGFENLQVDYLKKRYGKDIKKPEDS